MVFFFVKNGLECGFLESKNLGLDFFFFITKATSNDQKRWYMDGLLSVNRGEMSSSKIKKEEEERNHFKWMTSRCCHKYQISM